MMSILTHTFAFILGSMSAFIYFTVRGTKDIKK